MNASPFLKISGLSHQFKNREVLSKISFEVQRGDIFGLLGPNGSGKSTAISILAGLLRRQSGEIFFDGKQLGTLDSSLRRRLGMVFQSPSLDLQLTAHENLFLAGTLHGIEKKTLKRRIKELLKTTDLEERANESVSHLSGGMKRRLDIARALIHHPSVLLMDEPTVGLDEANFRDTWKRLEELRKAEEVTIIISTHRAEEAERCNRLAILSNGKIIIIDSPSELKHRVSGDVVVIRGEDLSALSRDVQERFNFSSSVEEKELLIECERGHELIPRMVEAYPAGRFQSISLRHSNLSDLFLKFTGQHLENDIVEGIS